MKKKMKKKKKKKKQKKAKVAKIKKVAKLKEDLLKRKAALRGELTEELT